MLILPIILYSFDILLKFNTAFYRFGIIVTNRKEIIKEYLKFKFW